MNVDFNYPDQFVNRHIGSNKKQKDAMLQEIGVDSLDQLIEQTVPNNIRLKNELQLPEAISEYEFLNRFKQLAGKNTVYKSYIGMGYYDCITPPVILRNILENPGWYTAYTPYQAEISQGRLEALMNFQTLVTDLTGMELANASLLDEATAAAEAMAMFWGARKGKIKGASQFFVSDLCYPQTIDVLKTRAVPLGIQLVIGDFEQVDFSTNTFFGAILQYPAGNGQVYDYTSFISKAHEQGLSVVVAADLLSLAILKEPAQMGADVVVGTTQRFGVPMGYGGPHAGYFATSQKFKRVIPGRIIGESIDNQGNKAYRMALQTREQHIRREKATSNICTAQVLLAVMASSYAVYHGSEGIKNIANRIHVLTTLLDQSLQNLGVKQVNTVYFDTLKFKVKNLELIRSIAENEEVNFYYIDENHLSISLDETTGKEDLMKIIHVFQKAKDLPSERTDLVREYIENIPQDLVRTTSYLQHPVFNKYHSEHEMLRYLKQLENKDLSLAHSMIALGSCTMKLNATAEMIPVTWKEFGGLHPFAPVNQARAYKELFKMTNHWLCEITGFSGVSFQPNSGAQGEYAGLLVIQKYHQSRGEGHRNVALIPSSAHGTNPATAVMVGTKVVVVACDENGNIDVADLKSKAVQHKDNLSCLMVTYPSTHGVFEESIVELCEIIHQNGGQVYMDGANMNAQVGLTSPANIGADVCHLNLHKTFCIPHGGGGPGVGPIGVAQHLVQFLPAHSLITVGGKNGISAVSAAPWGSASILPISYAYMSLMGGKGLKSATEFAILNANYLKARLEKHYTILYANSNGRCAHEMIVDFRMFKQSAGIEVEDIAKRLIDYGFHAPTVSFPVAGTLMIEPTESESKAELDRFCDALIQIRQEISEIENGEADKEDNVLKNAPHTLQVLLTENWEKPYSKEKAVYPLAYVKAAKFWPTVSRINNAHGDRNLICTCSPIEDYIEA